MPDRRAQPVSMIRPDALLHRRRRSPPGQTEFRPTKRTRRPPTAPAHDPQRTLSLCDEDRSLPDTGPGIGTGKIFRLNVRYSAVQLIHEMCDRNALAHLTLIARSLELQVANISLTETQMPKP